MVKVFKNVEALSIKAAEIFLHAANDAVKNKGKFTVALTGGTSPISLYKLLCTSPYLQQVPWSSIYVFWVDERWVPLSDDRSNAKMTFDTLLIHVPIPKEHIFPMWSEEQPEAFALQYEAQLRNHFGNDTPSFDLILLGMGEDGHTASLFPGTPVLQEKNKWVAAYYLASQSMFRITLTPPCINAAKQIMFIVFGENKANALYEVLEGSSNPEKYPAQLIQPVSGEVIWLADENAARKLSHSSPHQE